ncbi:hypothetical protein [Devosia sp. FJ2-5-3]|jgi:hypothetical protein|uniref:hypothetical protein n=1 Tax=Devosia sp. FJ2-5-3 TaxID=2976680 RepID=UPI0023D7C204|nr:hypothetical protein [Devosia sp. FJ2-5-3]WEJ59592.1 hypothetical protein N0P34_06090 [Devosia sp. FJ2-5-3]
MFLIQIALVLLLVGGGLTLLTQGKATKRREALILRRVDAYIETIRRERGSPILAAMSDSELRDLLYAGAHNLRAATQKRMWILLGVGAATLFGAILMGSQDGWRGFAATAAIGVAVGYGASEYLARKARAPLERHGVDVERLRVE